MLALKKALSFKAQVAFILSALPKQLSGKWRWAVIWTCLLPIVDILSAYWLYLVLIVLQGGQIQVPGLVVLNNNVVYVILILGIITLIRQIVEYGSIIVIKNLTQEIFRYFSRMLVKKYLKMNWLTFSAENRSVRIKHVTDTSLNNAYSYQVVLNLIGALSTLTLVGAATLIKMPLLLVALLITMVSSSLLSKKYLKRRLNNAAEEHDFFQKRFFQDVYQLFSLNREINTYKSNPFFIEKTDESLKKLSKAKVDLSVLPNIPRLLLELVVTISLTGILLFVLTGNTYNSRDLIASLATITVLTRRLLPSISLFLSANAELFGAVVNTRIVVDELKPEPDQSILTKSDLEKHTLLKLTNISFAYDQSTMLLENLSCTLAQGDSIAVLGTTGKGKSSLMMLAAGLIKPSQGQVLISNKLNNDKAIAYVAQEVFLLNDSILQNICFGNSHVNEKLAWQILKMVNLHTHIKELPQGIHTQIGDNGNNFSGGQRQRLSIARALYQRPHILLLDEATSALDEETEKLVMANIRDYMTDGAVIFITHRRLTAELFSNKTIVLS